MPPNALSATTPITTIASAVAGRHRERSRRATDRASPATNSSRASGRARRRSRSKRLFMNCPPLLVTDSPTNTANRRVALHRGCGALDRVEPGLHLRGALRHLLLHHRGEERRHQLRDALEAAVDLAADLGAGARGREREQDVHVHARSLARKAEPVRTVVLADLDVEVAQALVRAAE